MSAALFLVLGSDGAIGAYISEDLLKIDLAQHFKAGEPARGVWRLDQYQLSMTYRPTREFDQYVVRVENLCPRHSRAALPRPSKAICVECEGEKP